MDAWILRLSLLATSLLGLWLLLRRAAEQRRLPALLEQVSGRAVLRFSRSGKLVTIGPAARRALGLEGRADPITTEDLPLAGLDRWLAGASSEVPLALATGGGPARPVHADLVPLRPGIAALPAWVSFEPPPADPVPAEAAATRAGILDGARILLAEDGPDNQVLLGHILRGAGADLVLVENGAEAVDRARDAGFDLVLLDMQMPVMDGFEAARRIRAAAPDLPIVALTARAGPEDEQLCRDAGCSGYLSKPVGKRQLLDVASRLAHPAAPAETTDDDLFADPEFQAILADFLGDLDARLHDMEDALARSDWDALETLAHRLKGAAGGFGLPAISEASARIEATAREPGGRPTTRQALHDLTDLVAMARAAKTGQLSSMPRTG